ncbi:MAG: hypothetical protein WBO08_16725 [Mycobacterium sp.]|nr:hypothetical protein [Mycobacterium sp.]
MGPISVGGRRRDGQGIRERLDPIVGVALGVGELLGVRLAQGLSFRPGFLAVPPQFPRELLPAQLGLAAVSAIACCVDSRADSALTARHWG